VCNPCLFTHPKIYFVCMNESIGIAARVTKRMMFIVKIEEKMEIFEIIDSREG